MIDAIAVKLRAVTPSDTTVLNCKGFFVGVAGDVAVIAQEDSSAVTLTGCTAGTVYPIACNKIMSTDTDADDIVALY